MFFFETVKKATSKINQIEDPALPRKQKRPDYLILIHVQGYETRKESYLETSAD